MRIEGRGGQEITDRASWLKFGRPASARHWADGRSAKCLAESWLGDGPGELSALLATAPGGRLDDFAPTRAIAEAQTRFDRFRGGARNHDLLVIGDCSGGRTVVGIEGKADETFGDPIAKQLQVIDARVASGQPSKGRDRIEGLVAALGPAGSTEKEVADLRYQLFTAAAGTLAAAAEHGADQAVLCVQVFATEKTDPAKRDANAADLRAFVKTVLGLEPGNDGSWIAGPAFVPGKGLIPSTIPLWVAFLETEVARPSP
ncbi:MAG TPA: hypothetical protein VGC32_05445 [Solirubrobacterales bacterium]